MKQEGFSSEAHEAHDCPYSQGDIVRMTVKDIPSGLLPNGKPMLPVAFKDDFVCILSEYPSTLRIGDTVDVVIIKITKSHSRKNMSFGAVRRGE